MARSLIPLSGWCNFPNYEYHKVDTQKEGKAEKALPISHGPLIFLAFEKVGRYSREQLQRKLHFIRCLPRIKRILASAHYLWTGQLQRNLRLLLVKYSRELQNVAYEKTFCLFFVYFMDEYGSMGITYKWRVPIGDSLILNFVPYFSVN